MRTSSPLLVSLAFLLGTACSDPCRDVEIPAGSSPQQIAQTVLDATSSGSRRAAEATMRRLLGL